MYECLVRLKEFVQKNELFLIIAGFILSIKCLLIRNYHSTDFEVDDLHFMIFYTTLTLRFIAIGWPLPTIYRYPNGTTQMCRNGHWIIRLFLPILSEFYLGLRECSTKKY